MNREVHVRFWESPEVKVLRATRPSRRLLRCRKFRRKRGIADIAAHLRGHRVVAHDPHRPPKRIHSITSSAMVRSCGGTSMPSAFAVPRLITNSKRVGRHTGRSEGLSPLRMRPA
jgi:hypothetical protein